MKFLKKYKMYTKMKHFKPIKKHMGPFTYLDISEMQKLRKMAKQYKNEFQDERGYFLDYSKLKMPKEYYHLGPTKKGAHARQPTAAGGLGSNPSNGRGGEEIMLTSRTYDSKTAEDMSDISDSDCPYTSKRGGTLNIQDASLNSTRKKLKNPFPSYFKNFILKERTNYNYKRFLNVI